MRNEIEDLKQQAVEQAKQQLKNMAKESAKKVGQQIWSAIAPVLPYIIIGLTIFIVIVGCIDWGEIEASAATDGMVSASSSSWEQFLRFLHSWEYGNNAPIYNINGVDCYQVVPDGGGGFQVGYGIDIESHGDKLQQLNNGIYPTNGSYVPVSIVDTYETQLRDEYKRILEDHLTATGTQCTEYQFYALLSFVYNNGPATITSFYGGTGMGNAYNQYYSKVDNSYYYKNLSAFDENLNEFTKKFMEYNNGGLLTGRRRAEMCLFQTGYYGYDLPYNGHGMDEYWQPSYNTGGSSTATSYTSFDDFLFIGDSFTYGIKSQLESEGAIVCAKSGTKPSEWKTQIIGSNNTIRTALGGTNPKAICILLGVNQVSSLNSAVNDMKELIDNVIKEFGTSTPIYIQKVFPLGSNYKYGDPDNMNSLVNQYNTQISSYCSTKSNVYFVDNTAGCVDSNGYLKNPDSEGIHLTSNSQWIQNMKNSMLNGIVSGKLGGSYQKLKSGSVVGYFTSNITGRKFTIIDQHYEPNGTFVTAPGYGLINKCNRAAGIGVASGYLNKSAGELIEFAQKNGSGFLQGGTDEDRLLNLASLTAERYIGNLTETFIEQQLTSGNYLILYLESNSEVSFGGSTWCWAGGNHWIGIIGYDIQNGQKKFFPVESGWRNFGWYNVKDLVNSGAVKSIYIVKP